MAEMETISVPISLYRPFGIVDSMIPMP